MFKKLCFNIFFLSLIIIIYGCNNKSYNGSCTVEGTIENYKKIKLQLFEITQSKNYFITKIDVGDDGSFKVKFDAKDKSIYGIRSNNSFIYFINDVPELSIRTSETEFDNYFTEDSPESEQLRQLITSEKKMATEVVLAQRLLYDKMVNVKSKMGNDPELINLENKSDKSELDLRNFVTNYMDTVKNKLLAVAASSFINMNEDYNYLQLFSNKIKEAPINFKQKNDLQIELDKIKDGFKYIAPLKKIKAVNADEKPIEIDTLQNKYIFLNIWASWCYSSKIQIPFIMKAYEKHKNDPEIEFINVAIDEDVKEWKQFIRNQELELKNNLCDPLGKDAAILKRFGLDYIPANFLLDKQGNIITSNMKNEDVLYTIDSIIKNKQ
jgi:thiol-disulfide isomerase/thioredoxin